MAKNIDKDVDTGIREEIRNSRTVLDGLSVVLLTGVFLLDVEVLKIPANKTDGDCKDIDIGQNDESIVKMEAYLEVRRKKKLMENMHSIIEKM